VTAPPTPSIPCLGVAPDETTRALRAAGLRADTGEIREVARRLDRDLTVAEAFLIDVAHSEHCSYKSSRRFLRSLLPPLAPHVILGPGEDAGVIDLGIWDGRSWALVVAHESHNHPSQLLPIEGAATGIGGIVRDVYCMGADVVGVLDGLRFGDPSGPHAEVTRAVARGVVRGIWEYGNALGVPNLGGDLAFDPCYDENCLVNVVAFGVAPQERILRSRVPEAARREPYVLILVGKPTDRTGLGGASFASQVLDAGAAEENLGAVQIHDPFLKRVIVEATKAVWELLAASGCEAGFKDLGAGGLGGASSELVLAGGFGAEIELEDVPVAEAGLPPGPRLVAETQERFVWALPERIAAEVLSIYNETFDLPGIYPGARAAVIGRVSGSQRYVVRSAGAIVVDLPAQILEEPPVLERPTVPRAVARDVGHLPEPHDWHATLRAFMAHPSLCSRAHVYRHYDSEVRGEALLRPGEADAGVCRPVPGALLGVAVSLDGNGRWCDLDPYHGAAATVLEAVRNVVAVGARPRALTDCLNFGSPEDPECLWEFEQCLMGMRDACVSLGLPESAEHALPIVSGNVSFYNQSAAGRRIRPTPILACFGTLADWRRAVTPAVKEPGNAIVAIGAFRAAFGGSAAQEILRSGAASPPCPDLPAERRRIWGVLAMLEEGLARSCHDIGEGGLLLAAIESLLYEEGPTGLGLELDVAGLPLPAAEALLTEDGGFLLEVRPGDMDRLRALAGKQGVEIHPIGRVLDGPTLIVRDGTRRLFEQPVEELARIWSGALGPLIEEDEA
jgi:phosphoribosylformylglycinamidine synthase